LTADRIEGRVGAKETPIGAIPETKDFDLSGLNMSKETAEKLFAVDPSEWAGELQDIETFFNQFKDRMPSEMRQELDALTAKVG